MPDCGWLERGNTVSSSRGLENVTRMTENVLILTIALKSRFAQNFWRVHVRISTANWPIRCITFLIDSRRLIEWIISRRFGFTFIVFSEMQAIPERMQDCSYFLQGGFASILYLNSIQVAQNTHIWLIFWQDYAPTRVALIDMSTWIQMLLFVKVFSGAIVLMEMRYFYNVVVRCHKCSLLPESMVQVFRFENLPWCLTLVEKSSIRSSIIQNYPLKNSSECIRSESIGAVGQGISWE